MELLAPLRSLAAKLTTSGGAVRHASVRQQSSRGLAPTDATTRATDAMVQLFESGSAVSLTPRARTEIIPIRPPFTACDQRPNFSRTGVFGVGRRDVRPTIRRDQMAEPRSASVNVTAPVGETAAMPGAPYAMISSDRRRRRCRRGRCPFDSGWMRMGNCLRRC